VFGQGSYAAGGRMCCVVTSLNGFDVYAINLTHNASCRTR